MENTKATCPSCNTAFQEDDAKKTCPACNSVYHESCWTKNKGCLTLGCIERKLDPVQASLPYVCSTCNSAFGGDHNFCSDCGTPRLPAFEKMCGFCGSPLHKGQKFCTNCGKKAT